MDFPRSISFTVTNACDLRCRMCGQWSEQGYMRADATRPRPVMTLADWKRLVDEVAAHQVGGVLLRGGEPLQMPGIVELLEHIAARGIFTSIDSNGTRLADFADGILELQAAGADVINDISAMRFDPQMRALAARSGVPVILMHMRGEPRTMQENIHYDDVVREVGSELLSFRDAAVAAGIDRSQILVDPGIGFGKTFEHNLEILAAARELTAIAPVVLGASRKAFIGHLTGRSAGPDRVAGSLATVAAAHRAGAALVRVHDVRQTVEFLAVLQAIAERER